MENLIKNIIKNQTSCYFISPHLDDAALSAGELIRYLAAKTKVTVINVFTRATDGAQTLSARKQLKISGFESATKLYAQRRREDNQALTSVGAETMNLNYVEALWRKIENPSPLRLILGRLLPEFLYVYPVYRFYIAAGVISDRDARLITDLAGRLSDMIKPRTAVFCPYGIGGHADHLVVRSAVEKKFRPYYYLDQPYTLRQSGRTDGLDVSSFNFKINPAAKARILRHYGTQINSLFEDGQIPELQETFLTYESANKAELKI